MDRKKLGFGIAWIYICNIRNNQTTGHEMTHVLSYWAWGVLPVFTNRLINEGLAVSFDISNGKDDRTAIAKTAIMGSGIKSILEVWSAMEDRNWETEYDDKLLYQQLGGAFMQYYV